MVASSTCVFTFLLLAGFNSVCLAEGRERPRAGKAQARCGEALLDESESIVVQWRRKSVDERLRDYRAAGYLVDEQRDRLVVAIGMSDGALFSAEGLLDRKGVLHLAFGIRWPRAPERIRDVQNIDFFDLMVDRFARRATAVSSIWVNGADLFTLNEMSGPNENFTPEQAARLTWTGRQAARHGFTGVEIVDDAWDAENGRYRYAIVKFLPPEGN